MTGPDTAPHAPQPSSTTEGNTMPETPLDALHRLIDRIPEAKEAMKRAEERKRDTEAKVGVTTEQNKSADFPNFDPSKARSNPEHPAIKN